MQELVMVISLRWSVKETLEILSSTWSKKIKCELGRHWFTQAYIKTVFQVRYKWMRTRALSLRPLVKRSSFRCISRWVRSPA
ncbi:Uncharacterised protein [Vibrio cholerae]|nr:Uncharacterised protein [Vibrio cholerae]